MTSRHWRHGRRGLIVHAIDVAGCSGREHGWILVVPESDKVDCFWGAFRE